MKYIFCWLFAAILLTISSETHAQSRNQQVKEKNR